MADACKEAKYAALQTHHIFQPIAVETLGPINESARTFLEFLFWVAMTESFVFISMH